MRLEAFYCPWHKQNYPGLSYCPDCHQDAREVIPTIEADASTKQTNPKDAIGSTKLDMGLVPDTFIAEVALAFTEGALKYGRYNWRVAGVRASIYHAALRRHMAKWWNGENLDPQTGVSHLASAAACIAVLVDAMKIDKLTDDRPPRARDIGILIDSKADSAAHLKRVLKEHDPHQYTIDDGE